MKEIPSTTSPSRAGLERDPLYQEPCRPRRKKAVDETKDPRPAELVAQLWQPGQRSAARKREERPAFALLVGKCLLLRAGLHLSLPLALSSPCGSLLSSKAGELKPEKACLKPETAAAERRTRGWLQKSHLRVCFVRPDLSGPSWLCRVAPPPALPSSPRGPAGSGALTRQKQRCSAEPGGCSPSAAPTSSGSSSGIARARRMARCAAPPAPGRSRAARGSAPGRGRDRPPARRGRAARLGSARLPPPTRDTPAPADPRPPRTRVPGRHPPRQAPPAALHPSRERGPLASWLRERCRSKERRWQVTSPGRTGQPMV